MTLSVGKFCHKLASVVRYKVLNQAPDVNAIQPLQPDLFTPRNPDVKGMNRFAVIGDAGSGNDMQYDVAKQMMLAYEKKPFASVLVLGDNVYDHGEPHLFEDKIHKPYKPLFDQGVRFFPVLGNHDVRWGFGDHQLKYWGAPKGFYNYTVGPVEFFAIDTMVMFPGDEDCYTTNPEVARRIAKEQMAWLEKELSKSKAKFKVVYGHYPMYLSELRPRRQEMAREMREQLEPLFQKYGVNLYLAGHEHLYERSRLLPKGFFHIISGAAGCLADLTPIARTYPRKRFIPQNHFMLFEIKENKLTFQTISREGRVLDRGTIEAASRLKETA